jgi:hypothetical protein
MAVNKFFRRGKSRAYFLPTIASATLAPTVAEITAGTNLSDAVAEVNGFSYSNSPIDTLVMAEDFAGKIPGEDQAEDSSLVIYLDEASNPLRTTLAKGTTGFIVLVDFKPVGSMAAADKVDVYPVDVAAAPKERGLGNEAARWRAEFTVTSRPAEDIAVLA